MTGVKGQIKGIHSEFCSSCKKPKGSARKRYCTECHNAYMREWRKTHPLSEVQRLKSIVRSKTKMRIRRGSLIKQPCEVCKTEENIQAHHHDYTKPYDVTWLCAEHHREHHALEREKNLMAIVRDIGGDFVDEAEIQLMVES